MTIHQQQQSCLEACEKCRLSGANPDLRIWLLSYDLQVDAKSLEICKELLKHKVGTQQHAVFVRILLHPLLSFVNP